MAATDAPDYIRPAEAATIAYVSTKTLSRLADDGKVRSITLPSGHRRYCREDVEALVHGRSAA